MSHTQMGHFGDVLPSQSREKRIFVDKWHQFFKGPDALPDNQPIVSKH